jgi:hypothetical protein
MMLSISSRARVIAALAFFGCAGLLVVSVPARKLRPFASQPQAMRPRVTNKTSSVRIESVRQLNDGDVEVTLVNQSTKAIFAYTMVTSHHGGTKKGVTTYATAEPVAPGETKAERIPRGNLESNPDSVNEIVFSAAYLESGIVEGDVHEAEKLKLTMGGMKDQAKLALQILRDARASRESDAAQLLKLLESQAAAMLVKDQSVTSAQEREDGKAMVNERLLRSIKKMRMRKASPGFDVDRQLGELISYYERLAEKL